MCMNWIKRETSLTEVFGVLLLDITLICPSAWVIGPKILGDSNICTE